ncbi:MAG: hypothetical protein AAFO07_23905 [Bacteroidota bacterium]
MEIIELLEKPNLNVDEKVAKAHQHLNQLLTELRKRELPEEVIMTINEEVEQVNSFSGAGKELKTQYNKVKTSILNLIELKLKLVTKGHYRMKWMAVGMTAFGLPLGVVFGLTLGSMAFLGIGLPIGLAMGLAIGSGMDQKALEEGRQLDLEIKN